MTKFYKAKLNSKGSMDSMPVALRINGDSVECCVITAGHNCPDDYWVGYLNTHNLTDDELKCTMKISEFSDMQPIGLYI